MKHAFTLFAGTFIALSCLLPVSDMNAQIPSANSNTQGKFKLRPKTSTAGRPKAPSRQSVTCVYYDGTLTFEFAIPEGECQLILSDLSTGEIVAADFDSAMSEPIYVGYHSTASLTVTTANCHTYTGEW